MKKTIYTIVHKWKAFKWRVIGDMRKTSARIANNEGLPKLVRAIYAISGTKLIRIERKLAKEYLLYNPGLSDEFQKKMEKIVRDSGL